MDAMVERIERLERSNRRFRWAGGAFACLAVVGLVMGQNVMPSAKSKVLEVEHLIVGTVEAQKYLLTRGDEIRGLWASNDERTQLGVYSPGNNLSPNVTLDATVEDAAVTLEGAKDVASGWRCTKDGKATLLMLLKNDKSKGGMWMSSLSEGTSLILHDKEGRIRAVLGRHSTVTKKTGVMHQRPESSLVLLDEKGTVLHQVP